MIMNQFYRMGTKTDCSKTTYETCKILQVVFYYYYTPSTSFFAELSVKMILRIDLHQQIGGGEKMNFFFNRIATYIKIGRAHV